MSPADSTLNAKSDSVPATARARSRFQFSLGTFLLAFVTMAIVGGMLADEFRLANQLMQRVNRYTLYWWDHRQTMTRDDVRSQFGAEPTATKDAPTEDSFQWHGWLLTHEYRVSYDDAGHPTTTRGGHYPRVGAGALVLVLVAAAWFWRLWPRRS